MTTLYYCYSFKGDELFERVCNMRFSITDIGPFCDTQEIQLDGITILAGLNGTGKSTFGKLLYCLFSSFYHIEDRILYEKKTSIRRLLWNNLNDRSHMLRKFNKLFFSDDSIVDKILSEDDNDKTVGLINDLIEQVFEDSINQEIKSDLANRVLNVIKIEDDKIRNQILENQIELEFNGNFKNVSAVDNNAYSKLSIKDKSISFSYDSHSVKINSYISLIKKVLYIDDPNIVDYLDTTDKSIYIGSNHRFDLLDKLFALNDYDISSVDKIMIKEKIKRIEDKISTICDGDISYTDSKQFKYISKDFKDGLSINNMATGLKSFAIIKMLLKRGYFEENGIVVFDEPEIHLHPEWQNVWAEIIVMLHKEFGINVLISTHSSDFLSFLELYIHKYNVLNKTKLYKLEKVKECNSCITDVTNKWDEVYDQLGKPFIKATEELDDINA